jgi:acyl dehydratase|tara:strand:+ start:514 stop:933 length:420 start_codon:yes stop_codon:yes gene_type:complete
MTVKVLSDVEFGMELPAFEPDTTLAASRRFAEAAGYSGNGRFEDHEKARAQGLPGALVPGIMGLGLLTKMIHDWAPRGTVKQIDTVFRAPVLADHEHVVTAVVTDIDEDEGQIVLDLSIKNKKDETRVFGTATVAIPLT